MKIGIYYVKSYVNWGTPLIVSNGHSEIKTAHIELSNVSGRVVFNSTKESKFRHAFRHGTTSHLEIDIEPDLDEIEQAITEPEIVILHDPKRAKAMQERERYRKLHPNGTGRKKEDWQ